MARVAGAGSRVYVDEYNFSGRTNSMKAAIDINLPEVTSFSDDASEFVEGLPSSKATLNGFFDPSDENYDDQMWALIGDGVDHCLGLYPGNDASYGDTGYEIQGQTGTQDRPIEVAGAILLNCDWTGSGAAVRSTVLCNQAGS